MYTTKFRRKYNNRGCSEENSQKQPLSICKIIQKNIHAVSDGIKCDLQSRELGYNLSDSKTSPIGKKKR